MGGEATIRVDMVGRKVWGGSEYKSIECGGDMSELRTNHFSLFHSKYFIYQLNLISKLIKVKGGAL